MPASVGLVTPQRAAFAAPLAMRSGASLPAFELVYETYG
jgi:homoserine O-acetyltransferase